MAKKKKKCIITVENSSVEKKLREEIKKHPNSGLLHCMTPRDIVRIIIYGNYIALLGFGNMEALQELGCPDINTIVKLEKIH